MSRVIFHSDANSFYASVECLYDPSIRDKPVAVCGDPEARHGIVLTANGIAKKYGVRTGSPIWQAQRLCPDLVTVRPDYSLYLHFSNMLRALYEEYTDHVESFGLDECWLDMTQPGLALHDAARVADELRCRVREELGITEFTPEAVAVYEFRSERERELVHVYRAVCDGPVCPSGELDGGRFWPVSEIRENLGKGIFTPNFEGEIGLILG